MCQFQKEKPSCFLYIRNQNKKIQLNFWEQKTKCNITTTHYYLTDFQAPTTAMKSFFQEQGRPMQREKSKGT